jgi:hypothetical protein
MEPIFAFFNYLWNRLHSSPVIETIDLDRNAKGEVILPSSQHYQPCSINMFPAESVDYETCEPLECGVYISGTEARLYGGYSTSERQSF